MLIQRTLFHSSVPLLMLIQTIFVNHCEQIDWLYVTGYVNWAEFGW